MRVDLLGGGLPDVAVFRIVVADVKIEVALRTSEVKASNTSFFDNLPDRVSIEFGKERFVKDYA